MSNFIDSLVARSQDRAEVLQPRLTSLFEPERAVPRPTVAAPSEPESDAEIGSDEESLPDPASDTSRLSASSIKRIATPRSESSILEGRTGEASPESSVELNVEHRTPAKLAEPSTPPPASISRSVRVPDLRPAPQNQAQTESPTSAEASPGPGVTAQKSSEDREDQRFVKAATSRPLIEEFISESDRPRAVETITRHSKSDFETASAPTSDRALREHDLARSTVTIPPAAERGIMAAIPSPPREIRAAPDESVTVESPSEGRVRLKGTASPTIKVTIGRIDVRAVMPAQPAPRPAPAPRKSALSLDEYLKRRSGGRR